MLLHDDFETGDLADKWDNIFQQNRTQYTTDAPHVHAGRRALQFTVPQQAAELSNAVEKHLGDGYDVVFLRYYSQFEAGFDELGSSHNGAHLEALGPGTPEASAGVKADGRNKFLIAFENWRERENETSPGRLNVYVYHPAQRSEWGDHFFPTGSVLPFSYKRGDFGDKFVPRPDITQKLDQWYCYELMVRANTPGQSDGRIACWLDGKLIADFQNLRLRDVPTLKINRASVGLHIHSNTRRANKKWYDDVVIATAYIGPRVEPK
ncbi:MAG: hypothetical protein GC162_04475 [Planctomycetes bacterium]|nr:hypothetical protein [Planctomycetota bacterium]